ncbi:hypothetical protein WR25_02779 [Diploscapter pachys]|uniref:CBS domain-containing protein n=1 Tax=Diploscapter pachys TaxID=2018661 RepID=A0A2A2L5Q2_9BILA|nr:hypothetical protein WR25_02779 [Diploscapter pachys]
MIETSKLNVYCTDLQNCAGGNGHSSTTRRNSISSTVSRLKHFCEKTKSSSKRETIDDSSNSNSSTYSEKIEEGSEAREGSEEEFFAAPIYKRRMSVPEKTFMNANYAILRPSMDTDTLYEVVAAFDKGSDPYRLYMQNLECYDLAPNHGAVAVVDANLKIHKALTALSQCGHAAAVVMNAACRGGFTLLTDHDCLSAILRSYDGEDIAEMTTAEFLKSARSLIHTSTETSVWDAARLICSNSVHRIAVCQNNDPSQLLYLLSLRQIFTETVLKLQDPKMALGPHIKQRTLADRQLGSWKDIESVPSSATCLEVVRLLIQRRISSVPIVNSDGSVIGVISKRDLMAELVRHSTNYLSILSIPVAV